MSDAEQPPPASPTSRYLIGPLLIVASVVGPALLLADQDADVSVAVVVAAGLFGVLTGLGQIWPRRLALVRRLGVGGLSLLYAGLFVVPLIRLSKIDGLGYALERMDDRAPGGLVFGALALVFGMYFAVTGRSLVAYFYED